MLTHLQTWSRSQTDCSKAGRQDGLDCSGPASAVAAAAGGRSAVAPPGSNSESTRGTRRVGRGADRHCGPASGPVARGRAGLQRPGHEAISDPACAYVYVLKNVCMYCMYAGVRYIHIQSVHVCIFLPQSAYVSICMYCMYVYVSAKSEI